MYIDIYEPGTRKNQKIFVVQNKYKLYFILIHNMYYVIP